MSLQGLLPSELTGWLNPTDPTASSMPTPQQIQQRQQMAQALMQQGSQTSPIQSGWQGAARLAQGLMGGLQAGAAQKADDEGRARNLALMAKLLGGGDATASTPTPQNQALASALATPGGDGSAAPSNASLPTLAMGGAPTGGNAAQLANIFSQQEQARGLPAGYLSRTAQIESGFSPTAHNKSGAAGEFQFMPDTAKAYGLTNPMDPIASTDAAARLAADNAQVLRQKLGREPTAGELYLAHQQGAGGAASLLANPDAPAASVVGSNAVIANGGKPGMTAGQFAGLWTGKFGGGGGVPAAPTGGGGAPQLSAYMGPNGTISPANLAAYDAARANGGGAPSGGLGPLGSGAPVQVASLDPSFAPSGGVQMPAGVPGGSAYAAPGATAPAQQAITGATGAPAAAAAAPGGGAYGSVPLNLNGHMLTRQQAEDSDGLDLDGSDYDAAAAKAGIRPGGTPPIAASNAPPPSSSVLTGSPVPGAPQPTAYAVSAADNHARAQEGIPPGGGGFTAMDGSPLAAPAPVQGGTMNKAALLAFMSDPYTSPQMQQIAATLLSQAGKADSWQTVKDGDGSVWQRNAVTNEMKLVQDNSKATSDWKVVENGGAPFEFNSKTAETRPITGMNMTAYRPATPEEHQATGAAYIGPGGKPVFAPASTNVTVGGEEKASEKAFGEAQGKEFGEILTAGKSARATQGQLALMNDAFQQGNGQISTGPFAKSILGAKQAILNTTGIDLGGIPETEAVQKLGFGLATTLTKEISQRPAQQEFLKALENVPGVFMSPQGSKVMMSVLNQQAQQKIDLARLVANPDNRKNWSDVEQAYYEAHPFLSPFTGKPLSVSDVSALAGQAQQAGFDPATGRAIGSSGAAPGGAGLPADPLSAARAAIGRGASRDAVIQRLRQNGIDPSGL